MTRRGREGGFSLVELSIATAIMVLVLLVATQLLMESQWMYRRAAAEQQNPDVNLALAQLRNDLRAGASVTGPILVDGWSQGRLEIAGHPSGRLRYEPVGESLHRVFTDAQGTEARRAVLNDVTRWRWRRLAVGLVEVEIRHRLHRAARGGKLVSSPLGRPMSHQQKSHKLWITLRGRPRGEW